MKPNWPTNFSSQILNTRCVHFFLQNFVTSSLLSNGPSLWFFSGKTECLLYFVHWVTWSLNKVFVWVTFEFRTFFFHFHFSLSLSVCISQKWSLMFFLSSHELTQLWNNCYDKKSYFFFIEKKTSVFVFVN